MHGHGAKPHLCTYKDCERSLPGNGFPRRYNLFDHMKRVHDYKAPVSPPAPSTEIPHSSTGPRRQTSRKRKHTGSGSNEAHAPEKRNKVETPSKKEAEAPIATAIPIATQTSRRQSQINQLETSWNRWRGELFAQMRLLNGPADISVLQRISNAIKHLHDISQQWQESG